MFPHWKKHAEVSKFHHTINEKRRLLTDEWVDKKRKEILRRKQKETEKLRAASPDRYGPRTTSSDKRQRRVQSANADVSARGEVPVSDRSVASEGQLQREEQAIQGNQELHEDSSASSLHDTSTLTRNESGEPLDSDVQAFRVAMIERCGSAKAAMKALDMNRNGQVSLGEFMTSLERLNVSNNHLDHFTLRRIFWELDVDNSQMLSFFQLFQMQDPRGERQKVQQQKDRQRRKEAAQKLPLISSRQYAPEGSSVPTLQSASQSPHVASTESMYSSRGLERSEARHSELTSVYTNWRLRMRGKVS